VLVGIITGQTSFRRDATDKLYRLARRNDVLRGLLTPRREALLHD
jgi:hypothetical protein